MTEGAHLEEVYGSPWSKTLVPVAPRIVKGFLWFGKSEGLDKVGRKFDPVTWRAISLDAGRGAACNELSSQKKIEMYQIQQ